MILTTSDWIAIVGIVVAFIIGIFALLKYNKAKKYKIDASQKSGSFSKGNQTQNISIKDSDD